MIKIGAKDWVRDLRLKTEPLGPEFWSRFHPATKREVNQIAAQTGRELAPEFCEFYRSVGYGEFRDHRGYIGRIFSPSEILQGLPNPIFFITGSMSPGNEWAPFEQQTELWLSRGRNNPDPKQFTDEVLTLEVSSYTTCSSSGMMASVVTINCMLALSRLRCGIAC